MIQNCLYLRPLKNAPIMNLRNLKTWINQLPEQELDLPLLYNSIDYGISGVVGKIQKCESDLYYTGNGEDNLYTAQELKDKGYSQKDIQGFNLEIPKAVYYIEINTENSTEEFYCSK